MFDSATLSISVVTSRRFVALFATAHVAAVIAVVAANISTSLAALLLLLIGASAARQSRQFFSRQLCLFADGRFAIAADDAGRLGERLEVDASSMAFGSWLILRYADGGRMGTMATLMLARDSFANENDYRRCRRWFRWQSVAAESLG